MIKKKTKYQKRYFCYKMAKDILSIFMLPNSDRYIPDGLRLKRTYCLDKDDIVKTADLIKNKGRMFEKKLTGN